jgi:hypothetical protein
MPQLRVTQKYARDLKLTSLEKPSFVTPVLDDWMIDVVRVHRKKVAMATHVKTMLTFFIPYQDVGGAVGIPKSIGVLLSQWLYNHDFPKFGEEAIQLFNQGSVFCKTEDHKVLGHMNDFKRCYVWDMARAPCLEQIDWDRIVDDIGDMLITTLNKRNYSSPKNLMLELLGKGKIA